jgi:hypothetical protein
MANTRKPTALEIDAQLMQNTNCADCGQKPYAGGIRCWSCFKKRVDSRAAHGDHEGDDRPSPAGYKRGCRCRGCTNASSNARKRQRQRAA